jgi:hypothetical protein
MNRFCFLVCLAWLCAAPMLAQDVRASISGNVTDPTGAVVAGVQIRVVSIERGTASDATSNDAGRYIIQFLLPGKYTLTAEKPGFKKAVHQGITLEAADHPGLDLQLELGQTTESVTVTGDVSLLQTESATRSATIEQRQIDDIPTAGRNLYQFQYTLPGVIKDSKYWGSMELYAFGNINSVSIGGGRSGENESLLDGVSNTKMDRGVTYAPALNATQEVSVQTNSYDAQYGRIGGGVTLVTTKSGTNSVHGQLFEFLKNDKLNGNDWVANKEGSGRSPFKNSTFGFEVDGPVVVPKLFNGRNKVFFMVSMEGLEERGVNANGGTVATPSQRTGNFAGLLNGDGNPVTIYDPATTQLVNGQFVRTPFAGNIIPTDRISPVAAAVTKFIPLPNIPPDSPANTNNYGVQNADKNYYYSWLGRMDLKPSERSAISFKYGQTPWTNFGGKLYGDTPAETSTEWPSTRVSRNWGADWAYTLSPTMVFSLRGGLARYEGFGGNTLALGYDPRKLGFASALVSQFRTLQYPIFDLNSYTQVGPSNAENYETNDNYSITPMMNWIRGRHVIKFGAEFRRYNANRTNPGAASGHYAFDQAFTQANPQQADSSSGNDFASFLLGHPTGGFVDNNVTPAYHNFYYAAYFQDDFKVTRTLTLNMGLRWDYESPIQERYNQMVRTFDMNVASPIASQVQGLNLKGGLIYAGANGVSRGAFDPKPYNFQPRVGFAWNASPKWVIRGGYALSMLGQSTWGPATGYSQQTQVIGSLDGGLTPATNLVDPFPASIYPNGLLKPIGNSQGLATNLGQSVQGQYLDRPLPMSHQFSFGVQHELGKGMMADVSYVGNLTRRLPVALPLNSIPTSVLESMPVDQRPAYFNEQIANPMAGLLPNSGLNGTTLTRGQLLVAYPQYTQVTMTDVPIGKSTYHSLQSRISRRFGNGFMFQAAYTWSKNLEATNLQNNQDVNRTNLTNTPLEQRLVSFDIPHKFSVQGIYELPFGHKRMFGSNMNRVFNGVVGGWNLSAQYVVQTGFVMPFPNAQNIGTKSAKLSNDQRDALAKTLGYDHWDVSYVPYFDTSIFPNQAQAPFTLRKYPSVFPDVRAQGVKSAEISIYKEFDIKERVKWQIRADAYNAFNHPWFGQPLATLGDNPQFISVTSPVFGQLKADMNNETRVIALVMKVIF